MLVAEFLLVEDCLVDLLGLVSACGTQVLGSAFRVYGFGFRDSGFGIRVSGVRFRDSGGGSNQRVLVAKFLLFQDCLVNLLHRMLPRPLRLSGIVIE